jgi:hypothetical protein
MRFYLSVFFLIGVSGFAIAQQNYRGFSPCSFYIELPVSVVTINENGSNSDDYCDYKVRLSDGFEFMELHSMNKGRFSFSDIDQLYSAAINSSNLDIVYQTKGSNFFVITGYNKKGNIVYWRRSVGGRYISDMRIEYPKSRRASIDPMISRLSKSFYSY